MGVCSTAAGSGSWLPLWPGRVLHLGAVHDVCIVFVLMETGQQRARAHRQRKHTGHWVQDNAGCTRGICATKAHHAHCLQGEGPGAQMLVHNALWHSINGSDRPLQQGAGRIRAQYGRGVELSQVCILKKSRVGAHNIHSCVHCRFHHAQDPCNILHRPNEL